MTFFPLNWRCEARRETFSMRAAPYPDLFLSCSVQCDAYLCDGRGSTWWRWWCYQSNSNFLNPHCLNTLTLMLLGSMYIRSWLIQGEQEYPLDIWSSDKGSGHRIVILSPHWWNVIWSLIGRELWEPLPNQIFWTLNVHEKTEQCCTLLWTSWCRSRCRCTSTGTTPAFNSRILSRFSSCLKLNIWIGHKGRGSS